MSVRDLISAILHVWHRDMLDEHGVSMTVRSVKDPFPLVEVTLRKGSCGCQLMFDPFTDWVCPEDVVASELRHAINQFYIFEEQARERNRMR